MMTDLESIVGPFDPDVGLSLEQHKKLTEYSFEAFRTKIVDSPVGGAFKAISDNGLNIRPVGTEDDDGLYALKNWIISAHTVALTGDDSAAFWAYNKEFPTTTFAGPNVSHSFLSANTLFAIELKDETWPLVMARESSNDGDVMFVDKVVMLANCHGFVNPFPHASIDQYDAAIVALMNDETRFRKKASVVFWVTSGDKTFVYAGVMTYGSGGANISRVTTAEDFAYAINGLTPPNQPKNLTRPAAFCAALLTGVQSYLGEHYSELVEHLKELPDDD